MADTCEYYYYDGGFFGRGNTCSVSGETKKIGSNYYDKYCCNDYNMRNCPKYKKYGPYISGGCFITTIVCNTLGMEDNVSYLETLRSFRNNILQKNDEYKDILATYDVVGPIISCNLVHDRDRLQICKNLFYLGILNVCKFLENGEQDKAIELYTDMTNLLIQGYGITETYDCDYLNNMDMSKAGHGKRLVHKV